jgi:tRNA pseudouridine38/39 synthase
MTIKGSAFLWHQVRCMVAVLFLIGQGLESPFVSMVSLKLPSVLERVNYTIYHQTWHK